MNYLKINKNLWNARVESHIHADFYQLDNWKNGKNSLTEIELPLLGNVTGKKILHLQCHFGQDTISLAQMGASVTGLDFSEAAISRAKTFAKELKIEAGFICGNVYDTRSLYDGHADIVFTSFGVIGWLPELGSWAQNIAACLKPGGKLVFAEFHPFIWAFDDNFTRIEYSYFNRAPIEVKEQGTYADINAPISLPSISWNHALGAVFGALSKEGLRITHFEEYDYSPFPIFPKNTLVSAERWAIEGKEGLVPLVYSMVAEKL